MSTQGVLSDVLDKLVESYGTNSEINNLDTCGLPNRRAVVEAFAHICHLQLLGYYSARSVNTDSLRMALGEHLLSAYDILVEQTQRAARWEDRGKPKSERRDDGWAAATISGYFNRLTELRELLHGDITATYEADPAAESIEDVVYSYPGVYATIAYRTAHILFETGVPMLPRIISEHAHTRTGIDIHPGADIGENFFIDHGTGVVIGATTKIGQGVKIYQGVTLGALSITGKVPRDRDDVVKRHPTLEDNVTVYAGSTILGGDTIIGRGSVIGGNVWLTESVPASSKIFFRRDHRQGTT